MNISTLRDGQPYPQSALDVIAQVDEIPTQPSQLLPLPQTNVFPVIGCKRLVSSAKPRNLDWQERRLVGAGSRWKHGLEQ